MLMHLIVTSLPPLLLQSSFCSSLCGALWSKSVSVIKSNQAKQLFCAQKLFEFIEIEGAPKMSQS